MARFDVHLDRAGELYLLDCQSDTLREFRTRIVVPLMPVGTAQRTRRLNPLFVVDGQELIMATQLASALDVKDLGKKVGNLSDHHDDITGAFDFLITGI